MNSEVAERERVCVVWPYHTEEHSSLLTLHELSHVWWP